MALADRTLDLVNIPSESRSEAALYDYVRAAVPLETAYDDGESIVFAERSGNPLVLLAGHTDTVPAQGNLPGTMSFAMSGPKIFTTTSPRTPLIIS